MKKDKINCSCGHVFHTEWPIESIIPKTICPNCNKIHECKLYPMQIKISKKPNVKSICIVS